MILGVGAGYQAFPEYTAFGDSGDPKARASKLDEGLEVLAGLWSGNPVKHHGVHYQIDCAAFRPPLQTPRVPVWVAATWPAKKPLRRAIEWNGVVPMAQNVAEGVGIGVHDLRSLVGYVKERRTRGKPFDIIQFRQTRDPNDTAMVEACTGAGATWWLDYIFTWNSSWEATRDRLHKGPPRP